MNEARRDWISKSTWRCPTGANTLICSLSKFCRNAGASTHDPPEDMEKAGDVAIAANAPAAMSKQGRAGGCICGLVLSGFVQGSRPGAGAYRHFEGWHHRLA